MRALHQYYGEPSNYDVIDEKVMVEANMYGLPFYDFGPTAPPSPALPPTVPGGSDSVQLPADHGQRHRPPTPVAAASSSSTRPPGRHQVHRRRRRADTAGTLSVFYRPVQPQVSRDVTIDDPGKAAHGAWISEPDHAHDPRR